MEGRAAEPALGSGLVSVPPGFLACSRRCSSRKMGHKGLLGQPPKTACPKGTSRQATHWLCSSGLGEIGWALSCGLRGDQTSSWLSSGHVWPPSVRHTARDSPEPQWPAAEGTRTARYPQLESISSLASEHRPCSRLKCRGHCLSRRHLRAPRLWTPKAPMVRDGQMLVVEASDQQLASHIHF